MKSKDDEGNVFSLTPDIDPTVELNLEKIMTN